MRRAIAAAVVVVIIIVGAILIFHKSPAPSSSSGTNTGSTVPAVNNAVVITRTAPSIGQYLADPSGKPLYTYNADSAGVSNCSGSCLANWPAYVDTGSTSNLPAGIGTIKRTDNGQTQYTYNGMPLYYFVSDSPGHVTGNGVQNFSVAKPASTSSSSQSNSSSSSSQSSNQNNYPY